MSARTCKAASDAARGVLCRRVRVPVELIGPLAEAIEAAFVVYEQNTKPLPKEGAAMSVDEKRAAYEAAREQWANAHASYRDARPMTAALDALLAAVRAEERGRALADLRDGHEPGCCRDGPRCCRVHIRKGRR